MGAGRGQGEVSRGGDREAIAALGANGDFSKQGLSPSLPSLIVMPAWKGFEAGGWLGIKAL